MSRQCYDASGASVCQQQHIRRHLVYRSTCLPRRPTHRRLRTLLLTALGSYCSLWTAHPPGSALCTAHARAYALLRLTAARLRVITASPSFTCAFDGCRHLHRVQWTDNERQDGLLQPDALLPQGLSREAPRGVVHANGRLR